MLTELLDSMPKVDMERLLAAAVLLVAGTLVIKAVLRLTKKSMAKTRLEKAAVSLIYSLLKVVLFLLLGLMAASMLGIDVTGVVALASVASLALSLALQDALTNVIGGFLLLSNHPFHSGDYVEIGGQAGTVQTIDIAYTKLTTADNKTISIPNSAVLAGSIINYSTSGTRRIDISICTECGVAVDPVKEALLRAARLDTVLTEPAAPLAAVRSFREGTMEFVLQVWTTSASYWATLFTINENIKRELDAIGVEMTYPHMNVHIDR